MNRRLRGIDGLRGIAVLAVVLYHAGFSWIPGGFLGVDIFFVISGFIITRLLLIELTTKGHISISKFYARRTRRLLPALVFIVLFCVIASAWIAPDTSPVLRADLPWAFTFSLNWAAITMQRSYFVAMSRPPLLEHLWSLAIEEQFYLLWPAALIFLSRLRIKKISLRQLIFWLSIAGAFASTWTMNVIAHAQHMPVPTDPTRVYFGTDTHSMSLLIGCATAAISSNGGASWNLSARSRYVLNVLGSIAALGLGYALLNVGELSPLLYHGGFLAVSICVAVVVLWVSNSHFRITRVLARRPLTWFGDRSYGMYLWHWPIFTLIRPGIDTAFSDNAVTVIRFVLLGLATTVSYNWIEMPVRRFALEQKIKNISHRIIDVSETHSVSHLRAVILEVRKQAKESLTWQGSENLRKNLVGLSCLALVTCVTASGVLVARAPAVQELGIAEIGGMAAIDEDPSPPVDDRSFAITHRPDTYIKTVVFGDSVVLSGREALKNAISGLALDAKVGRQPSEIAAHIRARRATHRLGQDVVIHMGTNGLVRREDLAPILNMLHDRRRVVVVNVHVPRVWATATNKMIANIVKDYPNVRMADWNTVSTGHRKYFARDGFHLSQAGGTVFAQLIQSTLTAP